MLGVLRFCTMIFVLQPSIPIIETPSAFERLNVGPLPHLTGDLIVEVQ